MLRVIGGRAAICLAVSFLCAQSRAEAAPEVINVVLGSGEHDGHLLDHQDLYGGAIEIGTDAIESWDHLGRTLALRAEHAIDFRIGSYTINVQADALVIASDGTISMNTESRVNMVSGGDISIYADDDLVASSLTAGNMLLHAGVDGSGDLSFRSGTNIDADTILLQSGSGGGRASIDAVSNNPIFRSSLGAGSPTYFTVEQGANITDATMPTAARFGGGIAGLGLSLVSDSGTIDISSPSKFLDALLTLHGSSGVSIGGDVGPRSLDVTGATTISSDIALSPHPSNSMEFYSSVTLGQDVSLDGGGGDVSFFSTIDGGRSLSVETAGAVYLHGAIGAVDALHGVQIDADGGVHFIGSGTSVYTTGNQSYADAVTADTDLQLISTAGEVTVGDPPQPWSPSEELISGGEQPGGCRVRLVHCYPASPECSPVAQRIWSVVECPSFLGAACEPEERQVICEYSREEGCSDGAVYTGCSPAGADGAVQLLEDWGSLLTIPIDPAAGSATDLSLTITDGPSWVDWDVVEGASAYLLYRERGPGATGDGTQGPSPDAILQLDGVEVELSLLAAYQAPESADGFRIVLPSAGAVTDRAWAVSAVFGDVRTPLAWERAPSSSSPTGVQSCSWAAVKAGR
jgi:hypothetical protein